MMHLKNITAGNPKTKEQYQLTKQFNIKWLYSDDGKNWYEEQKNFQPDTLKMVYGHNGVIICIEKDVSAINPEGASVVELPDITANRRADISGKWMFKDGVVVKRTYTEEEQRQQAENEKQSLLQLVRDKTQLSAKYKNIAGVEEKLTYTDTYAQENVTIDMEKVDFKALQGISGINVSAEDAKKGITMAQMEMVMKAAGFKEVK